jgi:hypothetical protein
MTRDDTMSTEEEKTIDVTPQSDDDISIKVDEQQQNQKLRPVWMFWKKDDSLHMDPRKFSNMKKRLILMTVAFATST